MKIFMYERQKKIQFFLFFSLYALIAFSMEPESFPKVPIYSQKPEITSHNKYIIFDPDQAFKSSIPWGQVAPGGLVITPDGKGVVIAEPGKVSYLKLGPSFEMPKELFEQPRLKCSPIIAVAQKEEQLPFIIAAGNYFDFQKKKDVSEYKMFCNGQASESKKLDSPISGMWLDVKGDFLVISQHFQTKVIDLKDNSSEKVSFSANKWLIDVAINEKGTQLLFAENQGTIHLIEVARADGNLYTYFKKKADVGDVIQKIHFSPAEKEMLYLTPDGKARVIDMYDFLKNSPVDISYRTIQNGPLDLPYLTPEQKKKTIEINESAAVVGGNVPSSMYSYSSRYNSVVVDQGQGSDFATAHWIKGMNGTLQERCRIKIYRKKNEVLEEYILTAPALEEKYNYITECMHRRIGLGHFILVALRGARVIALGSDGRLYLWTLPDHGTMSGEVVQAKEIIDDTLQKREESFSTGSVTPPKKIASAPSIKSKSRLVEVLKKRGSGSRQSSRQSSRENSPAPTLSPRREYGEIKEIPDLSDTLSRGRGERRIEGDGSMQKK